MRSNVLVYGTTWHQIWHQSREDLVTKEEARSPRERCIEAVKDAQRPAPRPSASGTRAGQGRPVRLEELAKGNADLRKANLLASGAKPMEPTAGSSLNAFD